MKTMRGFSRLIGVLVGLTILWMAGAANATLIGAEVTVAFESIPFPIQDETEMTTVTADGSDAVVIDFGGEFPNGLSVDFSASSVVFNQVGSAVPNARYVVGETFTLSGLIWQDFPSATLTGVDLLSATDAFAGFSTSRVTIGANSIVIDMADLLFSPGVLELGFNTTHDVPEPASLALFVIALGGLGFMMRRRQLSAAHS